MRNAQIQGVDPICYDPVCWVNDSIKYTNESIEMVERYINEMIANPQNTEQIMLTFKNELLQNDRAMGVLQNYTDYVVRNQMEQDGINTSKNSTVDYYMDNYLDVIKNSELHKLSLSSIVERNEIKTTEFRSDDILLDICAKHVIKDNPTALNDKSMQQSEIIAEQMIKAMQNGLLDGNGQPIVQDQSTIQDGKQMGFAKTSVLIILTVLVSIIILVVEILLNY